MIMGAQQECGARTARWSVTVTTMPAVTRSVVPACVRLVIGVLGVKKVSPLLFL